MHDHLLTVLSVKRGGKVCSANENLVTENKPKSNVTLFDVRSVLQQTLSVGMLVYLTYV